MSDNNSRLVYSTETGRVPETKNISKPKGDGIVRIRRETKGRKGKGVCVVDGLLSKQQSLKLCTLEENMVPWRCQGHTIEIQGDNRDKSKLTLENLYTVKLAGG